MRKRPPTGPGGYELSAAHRNVLTSNRVFLVQKLDPYAVMDPLIRRKVFAKQDKDLVFNVPSREDAVRNLLNMLARRGPDALSAFISSSVETAQVEVANKLMLDAPDVDIELPHEEEGRMETTWCPKREFKEIAEPLRILSFHPEADTVSDSLTTF